MSRYEVYLADDHEALRLGVSAILASSEFVITRQLATMDEVDDALAAGIPQVLVTDFSMPGERFEDGLQYLESICRRYPSLPVVVLTMTRRPVILQAMCDCGVLALVHKGDPLPELLVGMRKALAGQSYISRSFLARVDTLGGRPIKQRLVQQAMLSISEQIVLAMLAEGLSMTEIAQSLGRSFSTVSTLKQRAMIKLGIQDNLDLSEWISRHMPSQRGEE